MGSGGRGRGRGDGGGAVDGGGDGAGGGSARAEAAWVSGSFLGSYSLELPTDDVAAWRRSLLEGAVGLGRSVLHESRLALCWFRHLQVVAQKGSTTPPDRRLAELLLRAPPPAIATAQADDFGEAEAAALSRESISLAAELHAVREEARAAWQLPARRLAASLAVVCGGRLRVLAADGPPRWCFLRVRPSASSLECDGAAAATLLGALPGLSSTALALHDLDAPARACGLRLVCKSYELDVLAASADEQRFWVRGVNALAVGSKHAALLALAKRFHPDAADAEGEVAPP